MDRRAFFSRGSKKVAEAATKLLDKKIQADAAHWIRPPFAIDEINFLLSCSRCDQCIKACPQQIIFPLPARSGVQVFNTPAMDLLNKSCQLCEDWPCVSACESDALIIPIVKAKQKKKKHKKKKKEKKIWPKIANVFINTKTCMPYNGPECGACRICPVPNAMLWKNEKPMIDNQICTGCGQCLEACIMQPKAIIIQSKYTADH